MMKALLAAATIAASLTAIPASAQSNRDRSDYWNSRSEAQQREYERDRREYQRDREEWREDRRDRRQAVRDWRRYRNYDWNRYEPGTRGYYAENYYRDGRYYSTQRLSRRDRIYRGGDGRYYCRRDDGTTGLIIGGAVGGLIGNELANGDSRTIATIIGAGAGALLGREVDRGNIRCR